jgi:N-formylmaleamate deformylase
MKKQKNSIPTNTGIIVLLITVILFFGNQVFAQTYIQGYPFAIEKTGSGRPMILIPGLYSSGKVWDETVAHFKNNHACYEITLPGFAGQPAIQSDSILKTMAIQLANFIRQSKLVKPILVGHSLGGVLILLIGEMYPDLPGGLIVVSSAPFLPGLAMSPDVTVDSSRKIGLMIKNAMKVMTPEQIRQSQQYTLPAMIHDSAKIALVKEMAIKSDSYTQGEVMYELFSMDLRPVMKNISCPILVLGDWISYKKYGASRENVMKNYTAQFSLAPKTTIALNDSSYHFIMYDEPDWFYHQMDGFLAGN